MKNQVIRKHGRYPWRASRLEQVLCMSDKPYNYEELEKKFPAQPKDIFLKRVTQITDFLENIGYKKMSDRGDGCLHFANKEGRHTSFCSFNLWQIAHETNEDFDCGFQRFVDSERRRLASYERNYR